MNHFFVIFLLSPFYHFSFIHITGERRGPDAEVTWPSAVMRDQQVKLLLFTFNRKVEHSTSWEILSRRNCQTPPHNTEICFINWNDDGRDGFLLRAATRRSEKLRNIHRTDGSAISSLELRSASLLPQRKCLGWVLHVMCIMVVLSVWLLFRLINWFPACEFSRWCSELGMWWSLVVCGVCTRMFAPKQVRHIYRISQSIFASKNITFLLAFSSHCVRLFFAVLCSKIFRLWLSNNVCSLLESLLCEIRYKKHWFLHPTSDHLRWIFFVKLFFIFSILDPLWFFFTTRRENYSRLLDTPAISI